MNKHLGILLCLIVCGCDTQSVGTTNNAPPAAIETKAMTFNRSDKSILTNNNVAVAADKISLDYQGASFSKGEAVSARNLTKNMYSSIGKMFKLSGKVYKVEELPPNFGLKGQWGEILLLTGNSNSPIGVTTIDYIYKGDISKVNSGDVLTCAGYFAGTFESQNAVGGTVEALVLVGDSVKVRH